MERLNRILEIDEENLLAVVQPHVITARPAGRRRSARPVLSAGSGQPEAVVARRQRRRVRRRPARGEVRHDQALRAGARSRAADRRDHPHRVEGGEERRRLRPDAAARRARRARWRSSPRSRCAWCRSRRCRRRCRRRSPTSPAAVRRRVAAARGARRAGDDRAHRSRIARRRSSGTSVARSRPPGTGAMLIIEVDGVPGGVEEEATRVMSGCREAGALERARARRRADERDAHLGGAPRAVVRAARARAAQDQPRRRRAARPRAAALRAGRAHPREVPAADPVLRARRRRQHPRQPDGRSRPMRTRCGARRPPSASCSKASSRSKARSAASTASASRRRATSGSSSRRETIALMQRVKHAFDPERHPQSGQAVGRSD